MTPARGVTDWDARSYHRVSEIQARWAEQVMVRLDLQGDETLLDAGCGSGRVTARLLDLVPEGRVIGVDASEAMIAEARKMLGGRATLICSDLGELDLDTDVDAVFSNAVFHWIHDHDRLFARLAANMRPGAQLVVQCGGAGNVAEFNRHTRDVILGPRFLRYFEDWDRPWFFSSIDAAQASLERAGFSEVQCWLDERPEPLDDPREFLRVVCLAPHLPRLPNELRDDFIDEVLTALPEPVTIDYVRLNIDAVKK
jgi:trans-aconitate 2-methyltransferase